MKKKIAITIDEELLTYCQADTIDLGFSLSHIINNSIRETYSFKDKDKGKKPISFLMDPYNYENCYEKSLKTEQTIGHIINFIISKFFRQPPKIHPDFVFWQYLRDLFPFPVWEKIDRKIISEGKKIKQKVVELFIDYGKNNEDNN